MGDNYYILCLEHYDMRELGKWVLCDPNKQENADFGKYIKSKHDFIKKFLEWHKDCMVLLVGGGHCWILESWEDFVELVTGRMGYE